MKYTDSYQVLGVERTATEAEITKAYRKLAHKYHPDVSKEAGAEEKFKAIAEAYKTLKDSEKRAAYDQLGRHQPGEDIKPPPDWQQRYGGAGFRDGGGFSADDLDLADLFAGLRGGRRGRAGSMDWPGQDFEVAVTISLEDAFNGTTVTLELRMPETDAGGQVRNVPRRIEARIPKGATDGQRLRLPGRGAPGTGKGRPGDLYLNISLRSHPLFRSSGHDLYIDLPLAPWEAVLGASVEVPTLAGTVRLKVPAGTVAGRQLRLPGRGLPKPRGGAGDLFAMVQIAVPDTVSDAERTLYEQLSQASTSDVRAAYRHGTK